MRTLLYIVLGLVAFGALAYGIVMFMTSGSRDIARNFITLTNAGEYEAAQALLHPGLAEQFPLERMASAFDDVPAYTTVRFASVEASGGVTSLAGTAETDDGCASEITFQIIGEQITAFNIAPLCR